MRLFQGWLDEHEEQRTLRAMDENMLNRGHHHMIENPFETCMALASNTGVFRLLFGPEIGMGHQVGGSNWTVDLSWVAGIRVPMVVG